MKLSREFVIGVVVVIGIAILYMGVNYLKGINLFGRQETYYAIYDDVAGLVPSNAVVLNGYKIGIVSDMKMHPSGNGQLVVEVTLNSDGLAIPKDTRLEIYAPDLFGGKAIQLVLGDSAVLAEEKDTLLSGIELGIQETIQKEIEPLKQKTSELFSSVDSILTSLNAVFRSSSTRGIPEIFESLQQTMNNLENSTHTLDKLLANNEQNLTGIFSHVESLTSNLKANNAQISRVINNLSTFSDTLAQMQLGATLGKVDKALNDFHQILVGIENGNGTLGQLIKNDTLHTELLNASHSLDLLLDDIQTHPKRYLGFSVFGRKESKEFSKAELEQMRAEIDRMLQEKK